MFDTRNASPIQQDKTTDATKLLVAHTARQLIELMLRPGSPAYDIGILVINEFEDGSNKVKEAQQSAREFVKNSTFSDRLIDFGLRKGGQAIYSARRVVIDGVSYDTIVDSIEREVARTTEWKASQPKKQPKAPTVQCPEQIAKVLAVSTPKPIVQPTIIVPRTSRQKRNDRRQNEKKKGFELKKAERQLVDA